MDNVFQFRDQLIERYGGFSRSFVRIAAPDIQAEVEHQYAQGLVSNSHARLQPLSDDYLSTVGEAKGQPSNFSTRNATAWYATDSRAERAVMAFAAEYGHLLAPAATLESEPAVLIRAERWLQAACTQWLISWQNIIKALTERTVIASMVSLVGVGNQMPLMLFSEGNRGRFAALHTDLSALVFDFVARDKTGGKHMNYFIYKQFPVLPPDRYTRSRPRLHGPVRAGIDLHRPRPRSQGQGIGLRRPIFVFDHVQCVTLIC